MFNNHFLNTQESQALSENLETPSPRAVVWQACPRDASRGLGQRDGRMEERKSSGREGRVSGHLRPPAPATVPAPRVRAGICLEHEG